MIATPQQCLSDQEIVDFSAGRLPGDRFQRLLAHLDDCVDCQQRADQTADLEDSFAAALGQPAASELDECEIISEADCQAALFHASRSPLSRLDSLVPPIESLGPYRLLRPLGRGGMGAVYLAEHLRLRKKCAIKLLPRERGFDADWLERFDREMQAVASLEHPNIVTATDAGDADGWHYLVMEYLDGLDLAAVVRRLGPIPIDIATAIARDVCNALTVIHEAGLVHRDIKPSNVMLTRDGVVKVLDLGLVLDDHQAEPDMRLTTVGHVIGTLAFAAPEQLSSGNSVDAHDLYGVGAMLFQLIAGHPAHESDRGIAPLVIEKTSKPARLLNSICPDTPDDLNELVSCLLDRDPENRPAKASDVAEALTPHATTNSLKRFASSAIRSDDGDDPGKLGFEAASQAKFESREPPSPRRNLIGLFGLPFTAAVILAGFLFYVQTDRGTLVIESDLDDVIVSVGHEDQSVDRLEISAGDNEVVLRSGRYSIAIETKNIDNVSVSNSQISIRRGIKTVVTIRRRDGNDSLFAAADDDVIDRVEEKLYKGEPLQHWMKTMGVEHDVSTLGDAMNAIASLAGAEDVDAAHSILLTTRRLGGWTSSNDQSKPTQQFMSSFNTAYARLLPKPGMLAIARELTEGNAQSRAACLWALLNFDSPSLVYGTHQGYPDIETWARKPENRSAAIALHDALRDLMRGPELLKDGRSLETTRDLSLKLALATERSVADEPGLKERLEQRIAAASKATSAEERVHEFLAGKSSFIMPLPPAQTIAAIELEIDLPVSVSVRSLVSPMPGFRMERNELFTQRFNKQTQAYADETVLALATTRSVGPGGVGFGGSSFGRIAPKYMIHANEALWKQMLVRVVTETSHPEIANTLLQEIGPESSQRNDHSGMSYQLSSEMFAVVQEARRLAESRLPLDVVDDQGADAVDDKFMKYAKRIIQRYDKNQDGVLHSSEWNAMLMNPAAADANNDSQITANEYALWMKAKQRTR